MSWHDRFSRGFAGITKTLADGRRAITIWQVALAAGLLVLVGTAVLIARGDASEQVAEEARVLSWSESVTNSATALGGEIRLGLVVAQSVSHGVFGEESVADAVERIRDATAEFRTRTDTLAQLTGSPELEATAASVEIYAHQVADSLYAGDVDTAIDQAESQLAPAVERLSVETQAISERSASQIQAVTAGVGTVTTAARFLSAMLIPILTVLFIYRAMKRSKKISLLRSEIGRERELRHKKDAFLAAASHHIRTPLAAVVGFAELLRDRSRDFSAGVRSEVTELLALEAEETANVVDNLLAAARYDIGELNLEQKEIDVRGIIDDATSDWAATQRTRLTISGNAVVIGDEKWLAHVLRNLLRNAASLGGEQIRVEARSYLDRAVIEISDNGEAIPAEEHDRIFELYYSNRPISGLAPFLGLGLSVARRIARAMGGDLGYYRADNENVFELTLRGGGEQALVGHVPEHTIDPNEGIPGLATISRVIEGGGPDIVYQPIVRLDGDNPEDCSVVGYEALARFDFDIPPRWFHRASALDMRLDLELTCIARAIERFDPPEHNVFLAVNLSDRTLHASRLLEAIEGIDPAKLILELSEGASIKSYEQTRRVVGALAVRGIRLAIDDIGSEDIDLWHMTRLGAHVVKIGMSLVHEMHDTPRSRALVKGIATVAQELGLLVVAEGVETREQKTMLQALDVEFGQGFLFGHPEHLGYSPQVDHPKPAYRAG